MSQEPNDFVNPYAATASTGTAAMSPQRSYGGIGRLAYFGYSFLAGVIYNIALFVVVGAAAAAGGGGGAPGAAGGGALLLMIPVLLIYIAALMWIVAQRMINTGYSPWWCVGMFVPILNILVAVRCIACPEGYADHGTLDTAGKVIIGIFFAALALGVVAVILAAAAG